jgi:hypothetical protein
MQQFPAGRLLNNLGVTLPQRSQRQFILDGRKWELPTFENAEEFVKRLVSKDLVNRDAEIAAALNEEPRAFSRRTSQRRFLRVVGIWWIPSDSFSDSYGDFRGSSRIELLSDSVTC